MKSLNKKIGVIALSGALLIGGVIASGKINVYANEEDLNALCYRYGFYVIDDNYNNEDNIEKDIKDFGGLCGVKSFDEVKYLKYNEFVQKIKSGNIEKGMYLVGKGSSMLLIGIPISNN